MKQVVASFFLPVIVQAVCNIYIKAALKPGLERNVKIQYKKNK
jgi:hypothetical protein